MELVERHLFLGRDTSKDESPQPRSSMVIPTRYQSLLISQSLYTIQSSGVDIGVRKMAVCVVCSMVERVGLACALRQKIFHHEGLGNSFDRSNLLGKELSKFNKMESEWDDCETIYHWLFNSVATTLRRLIRLVRVKEKGFQF